jgi:omega-hydroxy-beta-dihydromenaquinone-9 sulfotransferase
MPTETKTPAKREWAPRIWEGADYIAWHRLLFRNRYAVEPPYWYIAAIASCVTFGNMVLRWLQNGLYGGRIRRTEPVAPPIFVIGHWRTGTTLLHELLCLDPRHTSPTSLQCFAPNHFLLSEGVLKTYGTILIPERRPMDNMDAGWDRPQEDEFALCLLGLPSPYADMAFPNRPATYPGSLDLSGLTPRQLADWKRTFRRFVQALTFRDPRRLVLKSPPHTARVPVLRAVFPEARFVHIVRDPYVVFASTVNLWKSMSRRHGLQTPRDERVIREKVFHEFRVIYDRLEEAKPAIPPGHFHEVRYEELVQDTPGEMRKVYEALGLGGFDDYRPRLEEYLRKQAGYETNKYQLTDADREEVTRRWGDVIR